MLTRKRRSQSALVKVGPWERAAVTAAGAAPPGAWGVQAGQTFIEAITVGQTYRIVKSGVIQQVQVWGPSSLTGAHFYLRTWRRRGATNAYDLIDQTGDLIGQVGVSQLSTVTLAPGLMAQEGDYLGYRIDAPGVATWKAYTGTGFATTYRLDSLTPGSAAYPWESQTATAGLALVADAFMSAPNAVVIGDSIAAGFAANYSFVDRNGGAAAAVDRSFPLSFHLSAWLGAVVNAGKAGDTTTQIAARFATDCLALMPRYAVLQGGQNDLTAAVPTATILANFTALLAACTAQGVLPVVLALLPNNNGTTAQMQQRDQVNAQLPALVAAAPGALLVDGGPVVGQFRAGGDAGNLWNIQAPYVGTGGNHFNQAGYIQIAAQILAALQG